MHSQTVSDLGSDRYVDTEEAAKLYGLTAAYLRKLRLCGGGCRYFKFGRAVRYRLSDLRAWADSKAATSTSVREVA